MNKAMSLFYITYIYMGEDNNHKQLFSNIKIIIKSLPCNSIFLKQNNF